MQALSNWQPAAVALQRLERSPIYVSCVSVGKIYEGAFFTVDPQAHLIAFRPFLSSYRILTLTDPIMELFAELRAYLRRHGQRIPDFDLLIAATALPHHLTLLTFNRRDFERVPDLVPYQPV